MLALCLMLSVTYYAQNYAGIISWSLVDANVSVSSHFRKEELALAVDKWLRVISIIMLFKNSKSIKELKGTED